MTFRRGIYVVPTGRWYIERTVWMIAGLVLLACTLLAVLVNPLWIFGVIATGLVSINVAFTGFCPIGNVLYRLGFKPMLGRNPPGRWYFLQTDSWYLERRIYVTVGVNIILGSILFLTFSPWWALFTGFVGTAMVWFAATGLCILANILYWIGAEPRLNPGILTAGRAKVPAAARVSSGEKHA
jgi:hypothetical protein